MFTRFLLACICVAYCLTVCANAANGEEMLAKKIALKPVVIRAVFDKDRFEARAFSGKGESALYVYLLTNGRSLLEFDLHIELENGEEIVEKACEVFPDKPLMIRLEQKLNVVEVKSLRIVGGILK